MAPRQQNPKAEHRVVDAKHVAPSQRLDEIAVWLDQQTAAGWTVLAIDQGVIYLVRWPHDH